MVKVNCLFLTLFCTLIFTFPIVAQSRLGDFVMRGAATQEMTEEGFVAAHPSLPLNSKARVTNPRNGREIEVTIVYRIEPSLQRIIDLSPSALQALDMRIGENIVLTVSAPSRPEQIIISQEGPIIDLSQIITVAQPVIETEQAVEQPQRVIQPNLTVEPVVVEPNLTVEPNVIFEPNFIVEPGQIYFQRQQQNIQADNEFLAWMMMMSMDVREAREARELREAREARESRNAQEIREAREAIEAREARDAQEAREAREAREIREAREAREFW